jgi:dTDP-4-amino-4,6-dideoxygalactose transaminase
MATQVKTLLSDLGILGGAPAFTTQLHVGKPNIGNRSRLLDRINNMLDKGWLTNNGPFVQDFEKRISDLIGVKHCIAMSSGTIALEISIRALSLTGEVIVPSFTFIATAHALQWQQITPVFCDVNPTNHTMDPNKIESLITPRTSGIIAVHLWGRPCDVSALTKIADRNNLKLLFDASHAFRCSYNGRMVGSFGNAEVLSFHATKFINSFEGGAVVTNDDELAGRIRLMRNFGFSGYDNVIYIGTNGKMNEACACMGLTSLDSLEDFVAINSRNYKEYVDKLSDIPGLQLMTYNNEENCNYQYIVVEIDENITKITRDQLVAVLQAENILSRRYFYPGCHNMEPYRSYFPHSNLLLPVTEYLINRVMLLPTGSAITQKHIGKICQLIRFVLNNAEEIVTTAFQSNPN